MGGRVEDSSLVFLFLMAGSWSTDVKKRLDLAPLLGLCHR